MTVKRYTPIAIDAAFGMEEYTEGDYVTYSDYQKMVAENAEMKKFIVDECVIPHEFYGDNKDAADFMPTTPATDAAIAEIKAQGVDEWVLSLKGVNGWTVNNAREYAANLRAGRKG